MFDCSKVQSSRQTAIQPLAIEEFFNLAPGVISLGIGEPDFHTPKKAGEAGVAAITHGKTSYPPSEGIPQLRQEMSHYLRDKFGYSYAPQEICITVGGSLALDSVMRAFVEPGDEVILPTPAFSCYDPAIRMAGGTVVPVVKRAEDGFRLRPEALAAAITPQTKMLVLTSPDNPTGVTLSPADFAAIADVLRDTNVMVVTDEIYAELCYHDRHHSILEQPDMRERTLLISGFSKMYAMTGWRIGYMCAPRELLAPAAKMHSIAVMCASGIAQYAALAGLRQCSDDVERMVAEYDRRLHYVMQRLEEIGLPCVRPGGAFYVFPSIRHTGLSSAEFCARLRDEGRVAVIPGPAFGEGGEGFIRISYAYSMDTLKEAFDRIAAFCAKLREQRIAG